METFLDRRGDHKGPVRPAWGEGRRESFDEKSEKNRAAR